MPHNDQQYYEENGYVVIRDVISRDAIDGLVSIYENDVVGSKVKFFRQDTNRYERNNLNDHGYVRQSFLDPHNFASLPKFQNALLDIFLGDAIMEVLQSVTAVDLHRLVQTMFFDANTATTAHQDWWYLDSVPSGKLLAAWFALEDIDERAGRFFVIPRSHHKIFHDPELKISHTAWKDRIIEYTHANEDKVVAPELRKGDVLLWNSRTVHGALSTKDPQFSRRSLTGHYLPDGYQFGNLFKTKDWISYKKFDDREYYANQPEYSLRSNLESKVKVFLYNKPFLLKMVRKFQRRSLSN